MDNKITNKSFWQILWISLFFFLMIFFLMNVKGCKGGKEEPVVNVERVHDFSDSVISLVQTIILAMDSIRTQQELIRIQAGIIASKSKSMPRIKDLQAKAEWTNTIDNGYYLDTNSILHKSFVKMIDSLNIGAYRKEIVDSIIEIGEEKERMLDCVNLMNQDLFKSIEQPDSLENKKDSLNQGLIVKLNIVVDSLKEEGNRKERRGYWKGLKHGFLIGGATGLIGGVVISQ